MDVEETEARCPGCGARMMRLLAGAGVIAGCGACGGTWIDNDAARVVLAGWASDLTKEFVRAIGDGAAAPAPATYRAAGAPGDRSCPVCRAPLTERRVAQPAMTVDVCAHGTYFDRSELRAMIQTVDMRSAIQQMQRIAAIEDEDRRRQEQAFDRYLRERDR